MKKIDRTGEFRVDKFGSTVVIEKYNNNTDILVRFLESGDKIQTTYANFKNGYLRPRNLYDKSVYGVGYFGEGKHKSSRNNKMNHKYKTWHGMMRRGYDEKFKRKSPTYQDCTVAEEWHNFQNFGDWYDENYYEVENELMHLDKDILVKGNKIYSPETCVFAPQYINTLFINCESLKGKLPTCVYNNSNKENKKFTARTKTLHIGNYNTPEEAFRAYKREKELFFRDIANEYKNKIPTKLYEAMINYKVEINN